MTNGFYNTDKLPLRRFLNDAIKLSYNVLCQSKYKNNISTRFIDKDLTVKSVIDNSFKDKTARLEIIDRFKYNQGDIKKENCEYEIALHYNWTFLYVFVNEESFKHLIKKYKLKLRKI